MKTENDDSTKEVLDSGPSLSISDIVKLQDNLKKDIDFSKPDSELNPEELAMKAIYQVMDNAVEDAVGKDTKNNIDEARRKMEALTNFQEQLLSLVELGKEIEKNFIWQQAYLTNHFDKSPDNHFRLVIDGMGNDLVDADKIGSNEARVDFAKQNLQIIEIYREKVNKELAVKRDMISALLPALEETYLSADFELFGTETNNTHQAETMKSNFKEWIRLSKELHASRKKAIEAVALHLEMDEIIPKFVISREGDITGNISGVEMNSKGDRFVRLIGEADKTEQEISETRSRLSEELFGKTEAYMDFPEQKMEETIAKSAEVKEAKEGKGMYAISKGQFITIWIFAALGWLWALSDSSSYYPSEFSGFLTLAIPAATIFYSIGWRNSRQN